jgi:protein-L-isoaspartate(D-aspartate) O-methyltransferase
MTLRCLCSALAVAVACAGGAADDAGQRPDLDQFARERELMVAEQLAGRDIRDRRVLEAMRNVPRHQFVPASRRGSAYADFPLPIGRDQTISQPYIVAYMTQALELKPSDKVLEIGTGSGYQAAVLGELAAHVYTIEIVGELATRATKALADAGYQNVHVRHGDGYAGWPEHAPFDAIMVTAAPDHVPEPLIQQLAAGGRMIIPVGAKYQELRLIQKTENGVLERGTIPVRFVPFTRIPR